MSKKAYFGLLIPTVLLVLLILFIGYSIWGETWQVPPQFKYDILKDTLTIVLAVITVGLVAMGWAFYQIISGNLEAKSALASRLAMIRYSIQLFIVSGFIFWEFYDKAGKKEPQYLDLAIDLTERALSAFNELPDKEAGNRENDKSLCKIKNNLAYYFADRKKAEDKDTAIQYAEYLRERMSKYPEEKENWLDTCDFVYQQYQN